MASKNSTHYLKMDFNRAFLSWKFIFGSLGVFLVMKFASIETKQWELCVLNVFWLVTTSAPFLLVMIFAALPYANCFCDDLEHNYLNVQIVRGNLQKYTCSKVITIFVSSLLAVVFGMLLFVLLLRLKIPWVNFQESTYEYAANYGSFRYLLKSQNYILYFTLMGVQNGILTGVLALLASYASLFYTNKLFVLSVPVVAWHLIQYYGDAILHFSKMNLLMIFNGRNNVWNHDILSFLYACMVGILMAGGVGIGIYKRLQKKGKG